MNALEVLIDDAAVKARLQTLAQRSASPRAVLLAIGEMLVDSTKKRFETSQAPDGSTWEASSEVTLGRYLGAFKGVYKKDGSLSKRGVKRLAAKKPLIGESRSLSTQISYSLDGDDLLVGSPMEYATTHQFGASVGKFGANARGNPIPWGNIPARPFLGLSESDRVEILALLDDFLAAP